MLSLIASHKFIVCCTTRLESPYISRHVAPHALAIRIPCRSASYSASLFDGSGKFIRRTYFILSCLSDIRTTPAPAPVLLLDPSKYIVQEPDMSGREGSWASVQSTRKSGSTWDLMPFRWA